MGNAKENPAPLGSLTHPNSYYNLHLVQRNCTTRNSFGFKIVNPTIGNDKTRNGIGILRH